MTAVESQVYWSVYNAAKWLAASNSNQPMSDPSWAAYAEHKGQHAAALAIGATTLTWSDWDAAGFPPLV